MSKSSKNSFLMQGMILAAASIVCRVIGLLYRSPLFGIIGKEGMGYYSYAYNIYNILEHQPLSDIKKVQHLPFRSFLQRSFSLEFLEYLEDIFKDIIQWCQHPFPRSLSRS